jgi:hypothetical protein
MGEESRSGTCQRRCFHVGVDYIDLMPSDKPPETAHAAAKSGAFHIKTRSRPISGFGIEFVYRNSGVLVLLGHDRPFRTFPIGAIERNNDMLKSPTVDAAGERQETVLPAAQQEFSND